MNYGIITPDLDEELDDVPLDVGIDYDTPSPDPIHFDFYRSQSDISTRSLCSAMGSYMDIRGKSKHLVDATKRSTPEYDVPLHKLRGLRGVYKSGLITYSDDIRTRKTVNELLKWESSVYRHRKESPQLRGGSRNAQCLQNQPMKKLFADSFRREQSLPSIHLQSCTPKRNLNNIPDIKVEISAPMTPRSQDGHALLRRPPPKSPHPILKDDPRFHHFARYINLKQKKFRTPNEQYSYYEVNFPLLMHANASDTKPDAIPRPETPDIADNPELQRKLQLKSRLNTLENKVDILEEETTDIDFRTELRDEVFDPTTYEWNKSKYSETPPITPPVSPESAFLTDDSMASSPRSISSRST